MSAHEEVRQVLDRQLHSPESLHWQSQTPLVLAVYSEKGGVGKSALAAGLIAVAAANGLSVLGIDLDPRASLTDELDAEETGEYSVNDLLFVDPAADPDDLPPLPGLAAQALRPAGEAWGENVTMLASERALANRETDSQTGSMEQRLRVSLEGVHEKFDLTVIDLPPRAGGKLVSAGLSACTHIIFPATLDEDGLIGVRDARLSFKHISQTMNPRPVDVGVVRNIVGRGRAGITSLYDSRLADAFEDRLLPVAIPSRVVRSESRAARVPITSGKGTADVRDCVNGYTALLDQIGRAG